MVNLIVVVIGTKVKDEMAKCANCGKETDGWTYLLKSNGEHAPICCIQCGVDMAEPSDIPIEDKEEQTKRIAKVCGFRPGRTSVFYPFELGYACPLCGCANEELCWSEYKYFIWCPVCSLDIPSALCFKYHRPRVDSEPLDPRSMIKRATEVFLDSVETAKRRESVKNVSKKPAI